MKLYIRILIVAGIIVVAGLAIWKGMDSSKVASDPSASGTPAASATPVAISYDKTPSDWKTYASPSMDFTVAYPSDWTVGPCGPVCVGWAPPGTASQQYVLGVFASAGTIEDIITKAQPFTAAKEDIKIGGLTWLKLTLQQPETNVAVTSHFIAHNGQVYEFGVANSNPDILAVYGKMIASFKFK